MTAYSKISQIQPIKLERGQSRDSIENSLDAVCREIVTMAGYCFSCGRRSGELHCHHFISRDYKGVRWYLPNLIALCPLCHIGSPIFSAHRTPELFKDKFINFYGYEWFQDIQKRAVQHTGWSIYQLLEMKKELNSQFNFLLQNRVVYEGYR